MTFKVVSNDTSTSYTYTVDSNYVIVIVTTALGSKYGEDITTTLSSGSITQVTKLQITNYGSTFVYVVKNAKGATLKISSVKNNSIGVTVAY